MVEQRIDVAFRASQTTSRLTVNYNGGGATSLTLTSGLYMSQSALLAELQTQLQTVDGSLTATESNGTVTLAGGANFTASWTHTTLRNWLGYAANLSGASTYAAPSACPGVLVGSMPWAGGELGWRLHLKQFIGPHQTGGALRLKRLRKWDVQVYFSRTNDLTQLNSVLGYMLRRMPITWYRNTADATAWSTSNWDGKVECVLDPGQLEIARQWLNDEVVLHGVVPLSLLEYSS